MERTSSVPEASAGQYRKVIVAASAGTFIEIYDLIVYGYFAGVLASSFFPRDDPTAAWLATFAVFAVGFAVRPIGAVVFGHIGDRSGRRTALVASLMLMSGATLAFGLLPTYDDVGVLAPVLLLLCRVVQGLSASGEVTGASILVLEHAPAGWQGRAVAVTNAAGNLGAGTAAAMGLVLATALDPSQLAGWGWRIAFLAAAPIGLVGLYLRLHVLDSPAFLALGESPGRRHAVPLVHAVRTAGPRILVLLVWTAASSLGGYMLVGFLPSYLVRILELSPTEAFGTNGLAVIVLALSTLLGGYLVDRYPVRNVAIAMLTGVALAAWPAFLFMTRAEGFGRALVGQSLLALFLGATGMMGGFLSVILFPVSIRYTSTAVASSIGIVAFGASGPYVSAWLVTTIGSPIAPAFYLLAITLLALFTAMIGFPRETRKTVGAGDRIPGRDPG